MRFRYVVALRLAIICLAAGAKFSQPALAEPGKGGSNAESFVLENGMQVVVLPQRRVPVVTHMVWYKVGSADEAPGQSGIAHFFEHLMFKATTNHAAGELNAAVNASGGHHNAFTHEDFTVFFQQVPPDALGEMMAFEADRMRNLILDDKTIETERKVVMEERLMRVDNNPRGILREANAAVLFQNHPYGTPTIGWMHEIEALSREQLQTFYDRYYTPNNAVLLVLGDVDAETVRTLAERTYGKLKRGPELPPRTRAMEPEPTVERSITLHDSRITLPTFVRSWLAPAYLSQDGGVADALMVLSEVLGGGKHSRLYKKLVVEKQIASFVVTSVTTDRRDYSGFAVWAEPVSPDKLEEVERAVEREMQAIAERGISEKELRTAKQALQSQIILSSESQMARADIYGPILAGGGTVEDTGRIGERIEAVTADQVRDAARKYLDLRRGVTAYMLPEVKDPA